MAENELATTDGTASLSAPEFTREDLEIADGILPDDTQAVTSPTEDVERELRELAALRSSDPKRYWNDATQARERELIAMREASKEANAESDAAQTLAENIVTAMPGGEAEDFEADFETMWDDLPESAQAVIRRELALKVDPVRPANQDAIDRFSSTPVGKELVHEWRGRAGMKLAALQERMDRLTGAGEELGEWFDQLPPEQAKAIMTALAG